MMEISLLLFSGAFLLLVLFAIPSLLQFWRAVKSATLSLEILNQRLPGILKNIEETAVNLNRTSLTVSTQVEALSLHVRKVQGVLAVLAEVESILRGRFSHPVFRSFSTAMAAMKGVQAFLKTLRAPEQKPSL